MYFGAAGSSHGRICYCSSGVETKYMWLVWNSKKQRSTERTVRQGKCGWKTSAVSIRARRNPEVMSEHWIAAASWCICAHSRNSHKLSAMQSYITSNVLTLLFPISFVLEFSKYVEKPDACLYSALLPVTNLIIWVISFCQWFSTLCLSIKYKQTACHKQDMFLLKTEYYRKYSGLDRQSD